MKMDMEGALNASLFCQASSNLYFQGIKIFLSPILKTFLQLF